MEVRWTMLINKLQDNNYALGKRFIKDATIFFIDEDIDDFTENHVNADFLPLPSRLPSINTAIQFKDAVLWVNEFIEHETPTDVTIMSNIYFSQSLSFGHRLSDETKRDQFVNVYVIGKPGLNLAGWSVFDCINRKHLPVENNRVVDPPGLVIFRENNSKETGWALNNRLRMDYRIIAAFLNLLSCKNIRKKMIDAPDAIQKKRISRGRPLISSYYILQIKNYSTNENKREAKELWSNRIHFCRGHMRSYTAEAPLFGKWVGRFWIYPQVRGNKKKGMIIKDYEVPT